MLLVRSIRNLIVLAIVAAIIGAVGDFDILGHWFTAPCILFCGIASAWQQGEDIKKAKAKAEG